MNIDRTLSPESNFGRRIKAARETKGLTQDELIERLKVRGISMSSAALSKVECGETMRVHVDLLLAVSQILAVDVAELLVGSTRPGRQPAPTVADSAEAQTVGAMIDAMLPRSRRMLTTMARELLAADQEQKQKDVRIAELLQDGISAMERRTVGNGTDRDGAQLPLPKILPARQPVRQLA
jgi:transcriptional regulator with XRE-family HTH domain